MQLENVFSFGVIIIISISISISIIMSFCLFAIRGGVGGVLSSFGLVFRSYGGREGGNAPGNRRPPVVGESEKTSPWSIVRMCSGVDSRP